MIWSRKGGDEVEVEMENECHVIEYREGAHHVEICYKNDTLAMEMSVDIQDDESLHSESTSLHYTSLTLTSRPSADGFSDEEARSL